MVLKGIAMNIFFMNFLVKKAISPSNLSRPPPTIAPLPAPSTPASRPSTPDSAPSIPDSAPSIPVPPPPLSTPSFTDYRGNSQLAIKKDDSRAW